MELTDAKYIDKLDPQFQSVMGQGQSHPNPKKSITMDNDVLVPLGKIVKNKQVSKSSLLYNEFIVYNEDQVRMRYLVKVNFNYKSLF